MKRAIFLRELRVGLLQELVAAGVVLVILAAARWLALSWFDQPIDETKGTVTVSFFLIALLALLAFSSGMRASTSEARQRQETFFYVLPIPRGSLWLSIIGGRLAVSLPIMTLLFLAGPLLAGAPFDWSLGAGALALYVALFASGCCLSLLFHRSMTACLAGLLIVYPVLTQIELFTNQGFSSDLVSGLLWTVSAGLLSAAFLLLSWFFFQGGELQVRARQLNYLTLLGLTLAMILLFIGAVTQSPFLDRFMGPWTQDLDSQIHPLNWRTSPARLVSPGGRYLAVVETLRARPGISRVTVVETATGRHIGQYRWRGWGWVSWDAQHEALRILCSGRALPFFWNMGSNTASEWIELTPEGRQLTLHRLDIAMETLSLADGSDIIQDTSSRTRLVRWESPKGFRVLAEIPEAGSLFPWRGKGALVSHRSTTRMVRQVMNGVVSPTLDLDVFLEPYLLFLREIEARSGQRLLKTIGKDHLLKTPVFRGVSLPDRLALYLPAGGSGTRVHLYDGSLGQDIPLPACSNGMASALELIPTRNSLALLIRYQCRDVGAPGSQTLERRHFYYLPGSGSPKARSDLDQVLDGRPILLAYLGEQTAIWRLEKGETWKILQGGQIRTLWPTQNSELSQ